MTKQPTVAEARDVHGRLVPTDEHPRAALDRHVGYVIDALRRIPNDDHHYALAHIVYAIKAVQNLVAESHPSPPPPNPAGEGGAASDEELDTYLTKDEDAELQLLVKRITRKDSILVRDWHLAFEAFRLGKHAGVSAERERQKALPGEPVHHSPVERDFFIWRDSFRWKRLLEPGEGRDFKGSHTDHAKVISNAYDSFSVETVCRDNGWEILREWPDFAIVRLRKELGASGAEEKGPSPDAATGGGGEGTWR